MSETDNPDDIPDRQVYDYLLEHGPSTIHELHDAELTLHSQLSRDPDSSIERIHVDWRQDKRDNWDGETVTSVYYLDTHDPETVVRTYLDANPWLTGGNTKNGVERMFNRSDKSLGAAWLTIADEWDDDLQNPNQGQPQQDTTCPLCGETVPANTLPRHMRNGKCDD